MTVLSLVRAFSSIALVVLLTTVHPAAAADDQPWILDANNWQEGKDLLPEPVLKRLQKGEYWFKVVGTDPKRFHDNYSQKFWDASKANEGKFDVEDKQCGLREKATGNIPELVVGLPFPTVDPQDPQAARPPGARGARPTGARRRRLAGAAARSAATSAGRGPPAAAAGPPAR